MVPLSDTFYMWASGALFTLQTKKPDWLSSGGSTKPTLSHTWDELPWVELSAFIILISFSYQPNTGMLLKVHNRPLGVSVWEGHSQSEPRNSILSSPTTVRPASTLDSPTEKAAKEKVILVLLVWQSAEGVRLMAAPFLSTWTRTKVGSLRLSMILACGLLHQLVSALGEGWVWRAMSDRHPIYTADAPDWQV